MCQIKTRFHHFSMLHKEITTGIRTMIFVLLSVVVISAGLISKYIFRNLVQNFQNYVTTHTCEILVRRFYYFLLQFRNFQVIQSPLFTLPRSGPQGSNFFGNDNIPLSSPAGSRYNYFRSLFTLPCASAHKIHKHTEENLAQMLPLAVELLRLAEESCATMHLGMLCSLCG